MKKELFYLLSSKVFNNKGLKKQLLIFGGLIAIFFMLTLGTVGFIAYSLFNRVWTDINIAQVDALASEGITKSKSLLAQQRLTSPQCLQQIQNSVSINTLLNLGPALDQIMTACFSAKNESNQNIQQENLAELI